MTLLSLQLRKRATNDLSAHPVGSFNTPVRRHSKRLLELPDNEGLYK